MIVQSVSFWIYQVRMKYKANLKAICYQLPRIQIEELVYVGVPPALKKLLAISPMFAPLFLSKRQPL